MKEFYENLNIAKDGTLTDDTGNVIGKLTQDEIDALLKAEPAAQPRWRSPVVITTLAALVFFVVKNWIGFEIPQFDTFIELLIAAGLAVGILNNPQKKEGF